MRIQNVRYRAGLLRALGEFESHCTRSREYYCVWYNERMRDLITHAFCTVSYDRIVMNEGGIDPESIKTADNLR